MDPFIGEIRMFAGTFAPEHWAECNGQLLSIAEHSTLYAVIGDSYGGDGRTTFGVPDLRSRVPVGNGQSPGHYPRSLGQYGGIERNTLSMNQMPTHNHTMAVGSRPTTNLPANAYLAQSPTEMKVYGSASGAGDLATDAISAAGESQPVENMPPFQVVRFIIALDGIFPPRP